MLCHGKIGPCAALMLALLWATPASAQTTPGGSCSPDGITAPGPATASGSNLICASGTWKYVAYTFQSAAAAAGSSCSGVTAGTVRYNTTLSAMEFCNGSVWTIIVQTQAGGITAPAGSGYFVLTNTTYDGNLGGLAGANSKCLTELTTNTAWAGYSSANSNGQLVSSKVFAFLGTGSSGTTQNLLPLTTYYFASVGNAGAGGASFVTDSSGLGPGDTN